MTTQQKVIERFQAFAKAVGLDVAVDGVYSNTGWIRFSREGSFNVDAAVRYEFQPDHAAFRVIGYGLPDPDTAGALATAPVEGFQLVRTGLGHCCYDQTFEGNLRRIEEAVSEHVEALDVAHPAAVAFS